MLFIPTYLYIKQHTKTGKLYFGKTTKDPIKYKGSGKHWKSHIKTHGTNYIVTLWYQLYETPFDIVADALSMSKSFDIVNNDSWLNLRVENGLDGGAIIVTDDHKNKISKALKGIKKGRDSVINWIEAGRLANLGMKHSKERRETRRKNSLGRNNPGAVFIDVVLPDGSILYNTTKLEISNKFLLNYSSLCTAFSRNKSYKGFSILNTIGYNSKRHHPLSR